MTTTPSCPRCGGLVHAQSSTWQCAVHGEVHPLWTTHASSAEGLRELSRGAAVPVWLVLWPATAGVLLAEHLELLDLRDPWVELDLAFGAPSPLLQG